MNIKEIAARIKILEMRIPTLADEDLALIGTAALKFSQLVDEELSKRAVRRSQQNG